MEGRAPLCPKLWTILVIAAVVLLCFLLPEKPVSSDVMDMLPNIGSNRAVSKELTKRLDSQLIFAVKGDKAAESLNASLSHAPFLSNLRGQLNEENLLTFAKTISNHPIAFLSIKDIKFLENPKDYSRRILSALYSPFGAPSKGELDQDPLLLTRAALLSFPKQRISMEDGWLTVKEGAVKWRLLFASLKDNNSFEELKNSADSISKMISKAKASETGAEIYVQGAPLYSVAAGSQARKDLSKLGMLSLIALTLLLLIAYRSIRPLFLCLLSIAVGLVFGLTAVTLFFGHLHAITLVMCISIIGLCTDYTAYFIAARMAAPEEENSQKTLDLLRPTLLHALLTTVLTYSMLLFSPFPSLKELAIFTIFGLAGACLTVLFWFPQLTEHIKYHNSPLAPLTKKYIRFWYPNSPIGKIILCSILVFCAVGLSRLQVSDDLRQLYQAPKALVENEAQIQKILDRDFSQDSILLESDSEEKLLEGLARLRSRLAQDSKLETIGAFIPPLLPEKLQDQAANAAREAVPIVKEALENLNIRLNGHPGYSSLSFKDFLNSPIGENYRSLFLEKDGRYYYSIPIGTSEIPKSILQDLPVKVTFENKRTQIQTMMAQYRVQIGWLLVCAFAVIVLSIKWKFGTKVAVLSGFSLILSSIAGAAALGFFGMPFNVFSTFALILILGIGIDYQIFFLRLSETRKNSLFALFVAAVSTILSLGILGLSETAAVRNFGITLTFGVLTAFLTSPISLLLNHEKIRRL